jgi:hypothetical protein
LVEAAHFALTALADRVGGRGWGAGCRGGLLLQLLKHVGFLFLFCLFVCLFVCFVEAFTRFTTTARRNKEN